MSGFDETSDAYSDLVSDSISFVGQDHEHFTRRKADLLVDLVQRHLGPPGGVRALDVGCGVGLTDQALDGRIGELHGVDVAEKAVARAATTNPDVQYRTYDGARLPYADHAFDLTFAICVVHHVAPSDRAQLISELGRVVRPGGLVAIFEHNPFNPLTRVAVSRCELDEDAVLLSRGTAWRLLAASGLDPIERRFILFFPFERSWSRRLERGLGWLPLGAQHYVAARKP
jgi:SAM-dependent methyltransferase